MATKSLKLRVSELITKTFNSCRSKDPSTLPHDPVPSFFRLSPVLDSPKLLTTVDHHTKNPHNHSRTSSSVRSCHVSSAGCGFTPSSERADNSSRSPPPHSQPAGTFSWKREEKWHIVAKTIYDEDKSESQTSSRRKIYNSSASGDSDHEGKILALPPLPPPPSKKKRRGKKKKAPAPRFLRVSTSSAESGLFSSEGGEVMLDEEEEESLIESETLISSSRSFSTGDDDSSSEFNPHLETIRETPFPHMMITRRRHKRPTSKKNKNKKRSTNNIIYRPSTSAGEENEELPARLSVFQKLIPCSVDGTKMKESFAIVKKSEDPYKDFKRSMMEMILEKQMFEERDLEQLLQCFLSLNTRHYHGLIIEVFAEIWDAMFCASGDHRTSTSRRHVIRRNSSNLLRV